MKLLCHIAVLLVAIPVFAQSESDSLRRELQKAKHDTVRIRLRAELGVADMILRIGYWDSLAKDARKYKLRKLEGEALNNIGYIYSNKGDVLKALDHYRASGNIREEIHDQRGMAYSLNNIGVIYYNLQDYDKAVEYYRKALKIRERLKEPEPITETLGNLATAYQAQGKIPLALSVFARTLRIQQETNDEYGIALTKNNIGFLYYQQKEYTKALSAYEESYKIRQRLNDELGLAIAMNNLGNVYADLGQHQKALDYGNKSMPIVQRLGYPEHIRRSALLLYRVHKAQGNPVKALENYELFIKMRDSITNGELKKAGVQREFQYIYEKKAAADSVRIAADQKAVNLRLKQEQTQRYALILGLSLVLIFSLIIFRRFRITRRQKLVIERQEQDAQFQKHAVEEKNREITDSINYAKRLQEAILPPVSLIRQQFDFFLLYEPKDIIAGDFYWFEQKGDHLFITAADCTGHGVPGALVSIVSSNALNRAVNEFQLVETGAILDKTRELVMETFAKSESEVKDGMDISFCSINRVTHQLCWSGAYNPLWYFHEGTFIEIKGDKQSIGKTENPKAFTTHTLEWSPGDMLYLLTDGYADQFGGPKGKKFKHKQLQELLQAIHTQELPAQHALLRQTFIDWKGEQEQVDDVTVIGIRL